MSADPDQAERPAGDDRDRLRELEARLGDALPVLPVVCRQLTESVEQVERSVVQVCGDFQAIADKAQESVTRATRDLGAGGGGGVRQLADATAETIGRLLGRAEEAHTRLTGIAGRVEALEQQMQRIQTIIEQVGALSFALKILSLNARIEAARAGTAGAAFAVVAGETGKVAREAAALNQSIQDAIGRMSGDVRAIAREIRDRVLDGRHEVETARSEVGGTLGLLSEASDDLRRSTEATARDAGEVAQMIGRAVMALQFQDTISQRVGHAVDALREIEAELTGALPDGPQQVSEGWEQRLKSRFTMAAEHTALGGAPAAAAGNIELF